MILTEIIIHGSNSGQSDELEELIKEGWSIARIEDENGEMIRGKYIFKLTR